MYDIVKREKLVISAEALANLQVRITPHFTPLKLSYWNHNYTCHLPVVLIPTTVIFIIACDYINRSV